MAGMVTPSPRDPLGTRNPVTLQINLAPTDLPHAVHVLPHQLRQWAGQVAEIVFTVDLHRSRGKFAEGWEQRLPGLRALIQECCRAYRHARSVDVDYGVPAREAVAAAFFGGTPAPVKDFRGAPFYAYLYGLHAARQDYVLHLDSDLLFGGGSQTWVAGALRILSTREDTLACNPLPGPPTRDGSLRSQELRPEPLDSPAFRSPELSTRLFLLDRRRLPRLRVGRPARRKAWGARLDGNPAIETLEGIVSLAMARAGLIRLDFLGDAPGMWALHPPYRSQTFYRALPDLIRRVEAGDVPEAQRGCHDVEDCMVDWRDVRPTQRSSLAKHGKLMLERALEPVGRTGLR